MDNNTRHMTKTMVNKTDYREVAVCRNDLQTLGIVTGFDDEVRSNVRQYNTIYKSMYLEVIAVLHYNKHDDVVHAYVSKTCVSSK